MELPSVASLKSTVFRKPPTKQQLKSKTKKYIYWSYSSGTKQITGLLSFGILCWIFRSSFLGHLIYIQDNATVKPSSDKEMSLQVGNRNDKNLRTFLDVASEKKKESSYLSDQKKVWLAMEAALAVRQSDWIAWCVLHGRASLEPHVSSNNSKLFECAHIMDLAVSDLLTIVLVLMTLSHKQPL